MDEFREMKPKTGGIQATMIQCREGALDALAQAAQFLISVGFREEARHELPAELGSVQFS